jgi:hypothetical protein
LIKQRRALTLTLSCLCLVSLAIARFSRAGDSSPSLFKHSSGSALCCPPGVTESSGRCMEFLPRSSDRNATFSQCADLLESTRTVPRAKGELALPDDQFTRNGFQGETAPWGAELAPRTYDVREAPLAILSPACQGLREDTAPMGCTFYHEVDAYIALDDGTSLEEIQGFAKIHPWRGTRHASQLLEKRVRNADELREYFRTLARRCQVIRYALISSHGSKMEVEFHDQKKYTGSTLIHHVLNRIGLACLLVPESRIQFDGCQIACQDETGNGAKTLLFFMNEMAANPGYLLSPGARPFQGVQFLFASESQTAQSPIANLISRPGWNYNEGLRTHKNSGILYSVDGRKVITDVAVESAERCHAPSRPWYYSLIPTF